MQNNRSQDWLLQAQYDLKYAKAALRDGFYAQVCFISQQAAEVFQEKQALEALAFAETFIERAEHA